jgi:hypothetical protein
MAGITTPTAGLAHITPGTAGQAINALDVNLTGGYVQNPPNATTNLNVDPTGPASLTANGTTLALTPGQTFLAIPYSTLPVSVCSSDVNHSFISVQWK